MPKYRGITISVVSQWEMKQFPEFPHPDGARSQSQGSAKSTDGPWLPRPASTLTSSIPLTSANKADSGLIREATVSCYIPSIPGIRFFLKYTIEPPYPKGQLFYFKLFMNGRHVSSWGVNPKTNPRGQVLRGLFEPDETWVISHNSQAMLKQSGIESRPFLFTLDIGGRSAADDGGVIEVRTFRAKGRKRRAPKFETFRTQEQYGLNLPTAGLLDKPQDTRYYDYILVDPKDEPYSTFLFHYRSWEFLQSLQLIPSSYPQKLLKPSSSFAFLSVSATHNETGGNGETEQRDANDLDGDWATQEKHAHRVTHISQLHDSKVINVASGHAMHAGQRNTTYRSNNLPAETKKSHISIPVSAFSVPQATLDKWAKNRPLPRLPKAKSSFEHSRNSSASSNAPSITPSLIPWLNREADNPSPEPIIGVAVTVPVLHTSPMPEESVFDRSSYSSVEWSLETPSLLTQPVVSLSSHLAIPPEATLLPPRNTIRKSTRRGSRPFSAQGHLLIGDIDGEDSILRSGAGDTSPSAAEVEWIITQKGDSPTKRNSKQIRPIT